MKVELEFDEVVLAGTNAFALVLTNELTCLVVTDKDILIEFKLSLRVV